LLEEILSEVENRKQEIVSFVQELIRTPSVSGEEGDVAMVIADKMRSVGFDVVKIDRLNDVIGTLKGQGGSGAKSLLFNGHIDHVPVGDMLDPYSGKLMDGSLFGSEGEVIYGRGASDMKGAVASMVMAGAILKELDIEIRGDLKVVGVAEEERGGAGTKATIQESHVLGDVVIIGEATNMNIMLGHRGAAGTTIIVKGKSCHASAPERGINAFYKAMKLVDAIRSDLFTKLPDDPVYGKTTVAVTRIKVKPDVGNVIPEECELYMDCRNNPSFTASIFKRELEKIISGLKAEDSDFDALVLPRTLINERSEFNGFYTDQNRFPIVENVKNAVRDVLGKDPEYKTWRFATDGRIYARLGLPVIGFGPGEEKFAHTFEDHVRVKDIIDSVKAYSYLTWKLCN
jgi:putative selenium metabolism hydrolase